MEERRRQTLKLAFMIVLTFAFFLAEITGGYITGSLALVSDSYHMISDVLALLIGLSCLVISTRSSKRNTFGWARAEILGALVNSVFLAALCFTILLEAIERLVRPQAIEEPMVLLVIGLLGLLVNLIGLLLFCNETHAHSHSHTPSNSNSHTHSNVTNNNHHNSCDDAETFCEGVVERLGEVEEGCPVEELSKGADQYETSKSVSNNSNEVFKKLCDPEQANDLKAPAKINISNTSLGKVRKEASGSQMNIRGVFLHMVGDALGSLVVIISALVVLFCRGSWVLWVDPVLSVIMVLIIFSTTYPLLKQSALILMQHVPEHISVAELSRRLSNEIEGILGIHELHIWQLVGRKIIASLHVKCRNAQEYEILSVKIKKFLHNEGIHSTTIQPEFVQSQHAQTHPLERCLMECGPARSCAKHWCCYDANKKNLVGDGLDV